MVERKDCFCTRVHFYLGLQKTKQFILVIGYNVNPSNRVLLPLWRKKHKIMFDFYFQGATKVLFIDSALFPPGLDLAKKPGYDKRFVKAYLFDKFV